jgi:hypothetical protein
MQVLCKTSNESSEIRCSECGQGFMLFWERQAELDHADALREVEAALRDQHREKNGTGVHPEHGFLVPAWDGPIEFSGAAILGNAPDWAL